MRKSLFAIALAVVVMGVGFLGSSKEGDAAFHLMRVYGAMGGAFGDANIQYVELRMTTGGQNFVAGQDICFYDATGAPYAIFNFPSNAPSGTNTSILIGSSEFDSAWAAGTVDGTSPLLFTFSGSTVTQIAPQADVFHPIRLPAGKIAFGTETSMTPASMCQAGFTAIYDSVAYGTGYTGTVNFGMKFNMDMPSAGTQAVRLTGPLCSVGFSCGMAPDNSTDYSLLNVNVMANYPRNNMNQAGPLAQVPDVTTHIPWPNSTAAQLWGEADTLGTTGAGWFRYSSTNPGTCDDTFGTKATQTPGVDLPFSANGPNIEPGGYTVNVLGLSPGATYYYCFIVQTSLGTGLGNLVTFQGGYPPPTCNSATTTVGVAATLTGSGGILPYDWYAFNFSSTGANGGTTFDVTYPDPGIHNVYLSDNRGDGSSACEVTVN